MLGKVVSESVQTENKQPNWAGLIQKIINGTWRRHISALSSNTFLGKEANMHISPKCQTIPLKTSSSLNPGIIINVTLIVVFWTVTFWSNVTPQSCQMDSSYISSQPFKRLL